MKAFALYFHFLLITLDKQAVFDHLVSISFQLLSALLILIIGLFLIARLSKWIKAGFKRSHMEATAASFLESFILIALKGLLIITVVIQLGVEESSIVALLGTIGLAIGLALQGSLSNFAGGVLILILKPFKVDDYIEIQSFSGKIDKIQVFHTRLLTPDNKAITIPNGVLINSIVVNYSAKSTRRVDLTFQVAYDSDIAAVKQLLRDMLTAHPKILKEPEPFLRMTAQAASSLTFTARAWVDKDDYWEVYFDLLEDSKKLLDQAGIEIPYNKMDINVFDKSNTSSGSERGKN